MTVSCNSVGKKASVDLLTYTSCMINGRTYLSFHGMKAECFMIYFTHITNFRVSYMKYLGQLHQLS